MSELPKVGDVIEEGGRRYEVVEVKTTESGQRVVVKRQLVSP